MHGHTRGAGHIKAPANPNPVKFIPALGQADENNNPWGLGFVFFFSGNLLSPCETSPGEIHPALESSA